MATTTKLTGGSVGRTGPWCAWALATTAVLVPAARADHIDQRLMDEAPKVMKYLRDHHYQTVGVLKFSVKKGNEAPSFNAGTLNTRMAVRLEHALVLLNDPKHPINVIQDATRGAVAANRTASSRSPRGRRGLLEQTYPLAWGTDKKQPDALLTGEVQIDKDMKHLTIHVRAFDKKNPDQLTEVLQIKNVPTDREILASVGQSFVLSRKLRRDLDPDTLAAEQAAKLDQDKTNPTAGTDDPVELQIFYGDQQVTLEPDTLSGGELRVKRLKAQQEAAENQAVKFLISNKTQGTVGVVLAVNGLSTLLKEDLTSRPLGECMKWVLAPGETYTIEGFYLSEDGTKISRFKVLSEEESARVELAPEHKGYFSMFVFQQTNGPTLAAMNIAPGLMRGAGHHSRSLAEAQAALQKATRTHVESGRLVVNKTAPAPAAARSARQARGKRGLIVEGDEGTGGGLNKVDTQLEPVPSMSLYIRYYTPPTAPVGATPN